MRLIRWVFWLLLALIAALVIGAFFVPERASAERSVVIARPAAAVFPLIDGWQRFNDWSPWAGLDPAAVYTIEGPERGVGARMTWSSKDPAVGSGEQTIIESVPDSRVSTRLIFGGTQESIATMTLADDPAGTRVTWRLESAFPLRFDGNFFNDLIGRWFSLALDRFVGPDYERGLANLKRVAEAEPETATP